MCMGLLYHYLKQEYTLQVDQLEAQAKELCEKFPDDADEIQDCIDGLDEKWKSLKDEVMSLPLSGYFTLILSTNVNI